MKLVTSKWKAISFALIMGGVGTTFLTALGWWQLERLAWKTDLVERIRKAPVSDPVPVEEVNETNYENYLFKRVNITATWGKGPNYYVLGKTYQKRPGYHLMNVVELPSGYYLLVNLGWVPSKSMGQKGEFKETFVGRVRDEEAHTRWLLPAHKPGVEEWSYVDIEAMGQALGVKLLPFYVDMLHPDVGQAPYPVDIKIELPNHHFEYAIIWFLMAGVWAASSFVLGRKAWLKVAPPRYAGLK